MSHKINANALRLGISKTWKSRWYASDANFADNLHQDLQVKELVKENLKAAGLDRIELSRTGGKLEVNAYVARPGVAIGRGGAGIEELNKKIKAIVKTEVDVRINEVKKPDLSASIIASEIASGIERRMQPKVLAMNYIAKARLAGAKGVRVWIAGRLGGAKQARRIKLADGPVPLHTLKANIDYASLPAQTKDLGKFGIKVWVHKPDDNMDKSNN